jgi:hypothetical protein
VQCLRRVQARCAGGVGNISEERVWWCCLDELPNAAVRQGCEIGGFLARDVSVRVDRRCQAVSPVISRQGAREDDSDTRAPCRPLVEGGARCH